MRECVFFKLHNDFVKILRDKYGGNFNIGALQDMQKRAEGEPLDYIIGWVPFLSLTLDLSMRPFIPRPETEYWAGEAIKTLKNHKKRAMRVLDVFTGSGCIGIAVLKYIPGSFVTFVDNDPHFLKQAEINLRKNKIPKNRFCIKRSSFFLKVKDKFDVILANPPYVGRGTKLDAEVGRFEPRGAWFGGRNGLVAITRFLHEAKQHLLAGGEIWMEFGSTQKADVAQLLRKFGYTNFSFHRDQYKRPRYVIIRVP